MSLIMLVEDNPNLALALRHSLESDGHAVDVVRRGDEAVAAVVAAEPDLVILDLMLPGLDGFSVLRSLRDRDIETPVLVLSARGEDIDKVQGFRLGADDYVVKPVGLVELLLRVRAILRRVSPPAGLPEIDGVHVVGDLEVDLGARTVRRGGADLDITPLEFDLLACLIRNRGQAVTRERLLGDVWGFPRPGKVRTRTIDTHVATLRAKVEPDPAAPRYIVTVRKIGYRLEAEEDPDQAGVGGADRPA